MITSHRNPLIKQIKRLRQKKYRQQEGAFFAEGLRLVLSAVEAGAPIETIVYCSKYLTSDAGWQMLTEQEAAGRPCLELAPELFESVSSRDNPVGIGAVIGTTSTALEELAFEKEDVLVALFDVAEPGNLGTIIRTADATGVAGLILLGNSVDPSHPKAVKASMGSLFSVPIIQLPDPGKLWPWAAESGLHTIATSARAKSSYWQAQYRFPALLIMGSERQGLPAQALAQADQAVTIPMTGSATSLNLALATGLVLFELRRRSSVGV
jgi:TrmH family RNA methyltransferase